MSEAPLSAVDQIDARMHEIGLKQRDLIQRTGIRQSTFSLYMTGKRNPSNAFLESCAEALGLDVTDLRKVQTSYEKWKNSENGRKVYARQQLINTNGIFPQSVIPGWQIKLHMDAGDIEVSPADNMGLSLASIDLNRGECHLFDNNRLINLGKNQLILSPGHTARIHSLEKLRIPEFMVGRAGGMSFHIRHGVAVNFGLQLDPGYEGHPFALFTNFGNEKLELSYGEPFLSVDFSYIGKEQYFSG